MSGFEVVGVVLSVYPIIINLLQFYKGTKANKLAISLERSLKIEETIYTEMLGHLASFAASEDDLVERRISKDEFWDDVAQANLEHRLGSQKARLALDTLQDIKQLLEEIKTEVSDTDKILESARGRVRSRLQRFRAVPHQSRIRGLLEQLTSHNETLRRLLEDRSLPPCTDRAESLSLAEYLQCDSSHATDLYNAICNNYRCHCGAPHLANIGLPQSSHYKQMIQSSLCPSDQMFELLFSIEDTEGSIISSESRDDKDCMTTTQPGEFDKPQIVNDTTDQVVGSCDSFCATSWSSIKSIGESTSISPTSFSRRRHSSFSVCESQEDLAGQPILDLCFFVKTLNVNVRVSDTVFGILGLQETQKKYKLHVTSSAGDISTTRRVVCLEDLIDCSHDPPLSRKDRIGLALRLSHAVLQFYSTPWIDGCWTWRDFCVMKDDEKRDDLQLFVTHRFYSTLDHSANSQDRDRMISAFWECIGEPILTRLGFALIELALGKRLADMRDPTSSSSEDPDILDMCTAKRLLESGQVERQEGQSYEDVVRACLKHQFVSKSVVRDLKSEEPNFQDDVKRCIIAPLHSIWIESWGTKH